jgi:hypothetical protein
MSTSKTATADAETPAEAPADAPLPATVTVKSLWPNPISLEGGILEPGGTGEATQSEYANYAGRYLEKA